MPWPVATAAVRARLNSSPFYLSGHLVVHEWWQSGELFQPKFKSVPKAYKLSQRVRKVWDQTRQVYQTHFSSSPFHTHTWVHLLLLSIPARPLFSFSWLVSKFHDSSKPFRKIKEDVGLSWVKAGFLSYIVLIDKKLHWSCYILSTAMVRAGGEVWAGWEWFELIQPHWRVNFKYSTQLFSLRETGGLHPPYP